MVDGEARYRAHGGINGIKTKAACFIQGMKQAAFVLALRASHHPRYAGRLISKLQGTSGGSENCPSGSATRTTIPRASLLGRGLKRALPW